jgi:glyoxylase-like metal-dependent hydrolase (beta-lactamase superfamily II)
MEERFGKPTRALVLTHAHIDHVFGMGAFADVDVVLAESGRELMERQVAAEWTDERVAAYDRYFPGFAEAAPSARMFAPTVWFASSTTLGRPDRRLTVTVTGGHSVDSSNVWFEAERVLVAGDLVQAARRPYFGDPTTDMAAWIDTLAGWRRLGVARVCPGHGPVLEGADLEPIRTYFVELMGVLAQLRDQGVAVEDAVASDRLPAGYWPPGDPLPPWWPACIARAWEQAVPPG